MKISQNNCVTKEADIDASQKPKYSTLGLLLLNLT